MIWCVDDDDTIREIEVYALTQTGFEAKGFADGVSMLKALKTEIAELIVLDIMLPGKDGVEVLKEIKSDPSLIEESTSLVSDLQGKLSEVIGKINEYLRIQNQISQKRAYLDSLHIEHLLSF